MASIESMMAPDVKMQKALMHVVVHKPFWGALILRLKVVQSQKVETAATDGRRLVYNPTWLEAKSFDEVVTVLAHLVGHCMLGHPFRRGEREVELFNEAADHVVNLILKRDASFEVPGDAFADPRFEGMSVEQVYSILDSERPSPQQQPQSQQQQQQSQQSQGGEGGEGESEASGTPSDDPSEQQGKEKPDQQQKGKPQKESSKPKQQNDPEQQPEQGEGEGEGEGEQRDSSKQQSEDDAAEEGQEDEHQRKQPGQGGEQEQEQDPLEQAPGSEMGDVVDGSVEDAETGEARLADASEMQSMGEQWSTAAASAVMQAESAGDLAAGVARDIRSTFTERMSFEEYMRLFASKLATTSLSWSRPERRYAAAGMYLPSNRGQRVGKLVIGVDTSGSIGDRDLARFQGAARRLQLDLRPSEIVVLYCDWSLGKIEERFGEHEEVRFEHPEGGGGTSFVPVFRRVQEMIEVDGEDIIGVIYLTDLDGDFPGEELQRTAPPTLWVSTDQRATAPFGEVAYFHG